MTRQPTNPRSWRRLAVVLPLVVAATALPIVRDVEPAKIRYSSISLRGAAAVRADHTFALVGVSWPARVPVDDVAVRTRSDGARWGRWHELEVEPDNGPDGKRGARISTMPLWVGNARSVDVRFTPSAPSGARVHLIDPGADPRPALDAAMASPAKPGIISRSQWGADESMRKGNPQYAEPLKMAVVHHTATGNSYSRSESARVVRSIYAYHVRTNGWNDIGYNFLIDRYGQLFEGRAGGTARTVVGAHSRGFNRHTTGIAVIGTFEGAKPPEAAMQSLRRLVGWRLDRAWIDPQASTTYTSGGSDKWAAGSKVSLKTVTAHRDVGKTSCPGGAFYGALGWLRTAAAAYGVPKLYEPKLSRSIVTPNGDGIADGVRATGRFSSSVSWKAEVLAPDGRVITSGSGVGTSFSVPWYAKDSTGQFVSHDDYRFRISGRNSKGTVNGASLPFEVWRYPNGTFFIANGYTYILRGGKLRHPSSSQARATRYRAAEAISTTRDVTRLYPVGSNIGFREGAVVSVDGQLYVISDNRRRPTNRATLTALGYQASGEIKTTAAALAPHKVGESLEITDGLPDGAPLRSSDVREGWIFNGTARPLMTRNIRDSHAIRDVDLVGPADDKIAQGASSPPLGFRDGALVRGPGDPTIYVIADQVRRPVSARTFAQMGYKSSNVRTVTEAELSLHPRGEPV